MQRIIRINPVKDCILRDIKEGRYTGLPDFIQYCNEFAESLPDFSLQGMYGTKYSKLVDIAIDMAMEDC